MVHLVHTFVWSHPLASDKNVEVTGSYCNWGRPGTKLSYNEKSGKFEGTAEWEGEASDEILYKFIIDENWTTDSTHPTTRDASGIENNVLFGKDLIKEQEVMSEKLTTLSSVGPEATTIQLAADVPVEDNKENEKAAPIISSATPEATTVGLTEKVPLAEKKEENVTISSVAPQSTTAELAAKVPVEDEKKDPALLPTPDPSSVPGGFPETPAAAEVKEEQVVGVNPLPASNTEGSPITLKPGEEVPKEVSEQGSNVKLDKESYEKADADNFGVGGGQQFSVNPLPASATTGNPIDLKPGEPVPNDVKEQGTNVKLNKESYDKPDSDSFGVGGGETLSVNPLPAAAGPGNPISLAPGEKIPDEIKTADINENVTLDKESYDKPDSNNFGTAAGLAAGLEKIVSEKKEPEVATAVPEVVKESIEAAGEAPEAAGVEKAVETKIAVEKELVKTVSSEGTETAAAAAVPEVVKDSLVAADKAPEAAAVDAAVEKKAEVEAELVKAVPAEVAEAKTSDAVPEVVAKSLENAGKAPAAAASLAAVENKADVEQELKEKANGKEKKDKKKKDDDEKSVKSAKSDKSDKSKKEKKDKKKDKKKDDDKSIKSTKSAKSDKSAKKDKKDKKDKKKDEDGKSAKSVKSGKDAKSEKSAKSDKSEEKKKKKEEEEAKKAAEKAAKKDRRSSKIFDKLKSFFK